VTRLFLGPKQDADSHCQIFLICLRNKSSESVSLSKPCHEGRFGVFDPYIAKKKKKKKKKKFFLLSFSVHI